MKEIKNLLALVGEYGYAQWSSGTADSTTVYACEKEKQADELLQQITREVEALAATPKVNEAADSAMLGTMRDTLWLIAHKKALAPTDVESIHAAIATIEHALSAAYADQKVNGPTEGEQALQAKIDTLMLEYCPDEMPPEQMAEWERNQVMYQGDGRNKALTSRISTQIEDRWLYNGAKRSSKNVAAGKLAEAETSATAAVGGEWIAQVVSSGPANFSLLEWRFAELSISTPIGTKLYASVEGKTND